MEYIDEIVETVVLDIGAKAIFGYRLDTAETWQPELVLTTNARGARLLQNPNLVKLIALLRRYERATPLTGPDRSALKGGDMR